MIFLFCRERVSGLGFYGLIQTTKTNLFKTKFPFHKGNESQNGNLTIQNTSRYKLKKKTNLIFFPKKFLKEKKFKNFAKKIFFKGKKMQNIFQKKK